MTEGIIIELERVRKEIVISLMGKNNDKILSFSGDDVHQLLDKCQPFISEISHALYLGSELQKAKMCLENGSDYTQS